MYGTLQFTPLWIRSTFSCSPCRLVDITLPILSLSPPCLLSGPRSARHRVTCCYEIKCSANTTILKQDMQYLLIFLLLIKTAQLVGVTSSWMVSGTYIHMSVQRNSHSNISSEHLVTVQPYAPLMSCCIKETVRQPLSSPTSLFLSSRQSICYSLVGVYPRIILVRLESLSPEHFPKWLYQFITFP